MKEIVNRILAAFLVTLAVVTGLIVARTWWSPPRDPADCVEKVANECEATQRLSVEPRQGDGWVMICRCPGRAP